MLVLVRDGECDDRSAGAAAERGRRPPARQGTHAGQGRARHGRGRRGLRRQGPRPAARGALDAGDGGDRCGGRRDRHRRPRRGSGDRHGPAVRHRGDLGRHEQRRLAARLRRHLGQRRRPGSGAAAQLGGERAPQDQRPAARHTGPHHPSGAAHAGAAPGRAGQLARANGRHPRRGAPAGRRAAVVQRRHRVRQQRLLDAERRPADHESDPDVADRGAADRRAQRRAEHGFVVVGPGQDRRPGDRGRPEPGLPLDAQRRADPRARHVHLLGAVQPRPGPGRHRRRLLHGLRRVRLRRHRGGRRRFLSRRPAGPGNIPEINPGSAATSHVPVATWVCTTLLPHLPVTLRGAAVPP
ncbi:putative Phosphoglucosamine mutase [Actinacidiphila bryophytorum]|uniref:Phosphoglucosamine mutase n=1 Tax=Actinacidiphila bryophytorum TaxID=1436133 RepID=A0A9W4EAF2_9ACTN|nr:putative Phosphoglucosamine mutase [Actinacidiphila bryophytorum]